MPRISGDWRSSPLAKITASKAPAANTGLGAVPVGMRLDRMVLLLEASSGQQQALAKELQPPCEEDSGQSAAPCEGAASKGAE